MSHLIENIQQLKSSIPKHVDIVIATKYANLEDIETISSHFPNIIFGENRVQQGEEKQKAFPTISNPWHFIGHLQRNKVRKVLKNYALIHSVDSERLIEEIDNESQKKQQVTPILIQVNLLEEKSKFGFNEEMLLSISERITNFKNITIKGLMSMAPFSSSTNEIKKTFEKTRQMYDKLKITGLPLEHLSMGMSNDYQIAIDQGANMIRVVSKIFNDKN